MSKSKFTDMFGKEEKSDEQFKSPSPNLTENIIMTDSFRETLRRSGLENSALPFDESKTSASLDNKVGFSDSSETETVQTISEKPNSEQTNAAPKFRWRQSHLLAIAAIIAIIVFQSIYQFSLMQEENLRIAENLIAPGVPLATIDKKAGGEIPLLNQEIKAETSAEKKVKTEVSTLPKTEAAENSRNLRESPARTSVRKKSARESAAERLRRAERILTGV